MDRKVRNRFVILLIFAGAILVTIYGVDRFKAWYAHQIVTQIVEDELETEIVNKVEERLRVRVQEVLQPELESVREEVEKRLLAHKSELESIREVVGKPLLAENGKVETKTGLKKGSQVALESDIKAKVRRETETLLRGTFTSQMANDLSRQLSNELLSKGLKEAINRTAKGALNGVAREAQREITEKLSFQYLRRLPRQKGRFDSYANWYILASMDRDNDLLEIDERIRSEVRTLLADPRVRREIDDALAKSFQNAVQENDVRKALLEELFHHLSRGDPSLQ